MGVSCCGYQRWVWLSEEVSFYIISYMAYKESTEVTDTHPAADTEHTQLLKVLLASVGERVRKS